MPSGSDADASNKVSSNIKLSLPDFDGENWDEFKLAFRSTIGMNGWEDHLKDSHAGQTNDAVIQKQIYWILGSCCKKYAATVISAVPEGEGFKTFMKTLEGGRISLF